MKFTKMHGLGNDYIYFNCLEDEVKDPSELAIKLSDRHFGIGGDGIILILSSKVADFKMRMFNADGSEGKMCGNASRCVGKFVYERGLTSKKYITLETLSGIKELELKVVMGKVQEVSVNMGKAIIEATAIPINWNKKEVINESIIVNNNKYNITCVSMGNPHCITFLKEIDNLNLREIGPVFENNHIFPDRVNTEFVEVINKNYLKMRVWERGSGETLACGTGACAVVVAAVLNNLSVYNEEVTVELLGGKLKIKYLEDGTVYMIGTAEFVYEGRIIDE